MAVPNLFILGAQKAGTTYLGKSFAAHPDIFFSEPKELLFFHRQDVSDEGFARYKKKYFSDVGDATWIAEGSTTYLQWPEALSNIRRYIPGRPKFIVCMRQLTEKSVSFFIHNWRRDRYAAGTRITDTVPMQIALSPRETGLYAPSIKRWFELYPREDFCFLNFDWLREDPAKFVGKATDFLGVSPADHIPDKLVNAGLPLKWQGDKLTIASGMAEHQQRPIFAPEELRKLHEMFLPDVAETEELTGLDLSAWRKMPTFG